MTFHYTDPDGDRLTVFPTTRDDGTPVITIRAEDWSFGEQAIGQGAVDIPADRIEELVAGIRDTARQAATGARA